MTKVVGVRFSDTGKMYYFDPKGFDIKNGQEIIVETAMGLNSVRLQQELSLLRMMKL